VHNFLAEFQVVLPLLRVEEPGDERRAEAGDDAEGVVVEEVGEGVEDGEARDHANVVGEHGLVELRSGQVGNGGG